MTTAPAEAGAEADGARTAGDAGPEARADGTTADAGDTADAGGTGGVDVGEGAGVATGAGLAGVSLIGDSTAFPPDDPAGTGPGSVTGDELEVTARSRRPAAWSEEVAAGAARTVLVCGRLAEGTPTPEAAVLQVRTAVRALARLDLTPADALGQLGGILAEWDTPFRAHVAYLVVDPTEDVVTYATAGHPPPLVVAPDGTVTALPEVAGGPAGGPGGPHVEGTAALPAGASLVVRTPSVAEDRAGGRPDVPPGVLADVVSAACVGGAHEAADALDRDLGPAPALLVARRVGAPGDTGRVRVIELALAEGEEPTRRARAFCYGVLSTWHLPPLVRDDIVLAVSELVANALLHGGAAEFLRLRRTPRRVVVEVFDREAALPRPRIADSDAESGRGLFLVRRVASRWGARRVPGGKAVWCEFEVPAAQAPQAVFG